MVTLADIKNFFQEYWGYLLLGVSGFSLLGVGVYYVFNEQPEPVVVEQNEALRDGDQTKKQKTKKNILDPVIDNIYWSIASFAVYYSVYLWLRRSEYKDQATWIIVLSIVLGKIGLAAFSSFYYQKNDFLQNLNKSINPAYFINQEADRIILALAGYFGLATLIYFDWKEPGQQPIGGQQPGNQVLNQNQNGQQLLRQQQISEKENLKILFDFFLTESPYVYVINKLKENKIFDLKQLFKPIEKNFLLGKITMDGVLDLIGLYDAHPNLFVYRPKYRHYYVKRFYRSIAPFLHCFFFCIEFFLNEKKALQKIVVKNYLEKLMDNPDDNKIKSLNETISEFFYFLNCVENLRDYIFPDLYLTKYDFKTTEEIQQYHLKFLKNIVKKLHLENAFQQQVLNVTVDHCQSIEAFHWFLMNNRNQIKIDEINYQEISQPE